MSPLFRVGIPESGRRALAQLSALSDDEFEKMRAAYSVSDAVLPIERFTSNVATESGLDRNCIEDVTDMLVGVVGLQRATNLSVDEIINEVVTSAVSSSASTYKFDPSKSAQTASRLAILLSIDGVITVAKALDLAEESERILDSVQITSDVRPIFLEQTDIGVSASIIVHTLRLTFREGTQRQSIYISMNEDDIEALRKVLNRAEAKAKKLRLLLSETDAHVLEEES